MSKKKAVVLLAPGFEEIEALTPIDVLRRAGAEVTIAGVGTMNPEGAHGVTVGADVLIGGLSGDFDMVVCPGGSPGSRNLGESPEAKKLALEMFKAGKFVTAICAAPVLTLGAWGILSGRKATCYPGMESMFPKDVSFSPDRVVVDGKLVTSRGPGTALEFALALVTRLFDAATSAKVASEMVAK